MSPSSTLTEAAARAAMPKATEYQLTDGHGLRLRVLPNGTKTWVVRLRDLNGFKQATLGTYPAMTFDAAQTAAAAARDDAKRADARPDLHARATAALGGLLDVFNTLRGELGRDVELSDLRRVLRKPRSDSKP